VLEVMLVEMLGKMLEHQYQYIRRKLMSVSEFHESSPPYTNPTIACPKVG